MIVVGSVVMEIVDVFGWYSMLWVFVCLFVCFEMWNRMNEVVEVEVEVRMLCCEVK